MRFDTTKNKNNKKLQFLYRIGGGILVVILALSLLRNITAIGVANQKIAASRARVEKLKKDNETLKEKVLSVQSEAYLEKQARDKLGLAKEGEIVVVLPDPEKLKALAPKPEEEEEETIPDPNWKKWLKLFF